MTKPMTEYERQYPLLKEEIAKLKAQLEACSRRNEADADRIAELEWLCKKERNDRFDHAASLEGEIAELARQNSDLMNGLAVRVPSHQGGTTVFHVGEANHAESAIRKKLIEMGWTPPAGKVEGEQ